MRLGLGTVQFGLDYGVSNRTGKPSVEAVGEILDVASAAGLRILDTAPAYGEAERRIGGWLERAGPRFDVVTKTAKLAATGTIQASHVARLDEAFATSLASLGATKVYGLLVHSTDDVFLAGGERLIEWMQARRHAGQIEKIGVSVYGPDQLARVLDRFTPDLVQLPVNVLDQRTIASGALRDLKRRGVEVHARSAFLQGLLLMDPDDASRRMGRPLPELTRYHAERLDRGLSPLEAALAFVKSVPEIDCVLVGVQTAAELRQILAAWDVPFPKALDYSSFACSEERVINPSLWSRHA